MGKIFVYFTVFLSYNFSMEENKDLDFFGGDAPQVHTVNDGLNSRTGGITFSVLVAAYFLLSLAVSAVTALIAVSIMNKYGYTQVGDAVDRVQRHDGFIYASYLVSPIMITLCALFITKRYKIRFTRIFPVKCHPKYYALAVLLIFGLLFSCSYINVAMVEFFKLFGYKPRDSANYFPSLSGGLIVPALIVMAVMPAVFEELMFRGLLLQSGRNGMGDIRAVFVTGFCFSLFHASPEQTVYQFIVGCVSAFLVIRSGSVLPSLLMHFINNALVVILNACNVFDEGGSLIISDTGFIILTVFSALSLLGALVWLILIKSPLSRGEKGGVKVFFKYSSVGIAALSLVWLLSLFGVA